MVNTNDANTNNLLGTFSVIYPVKVELMTYATASNAKMVPLYLGSMCLSFLSTIVMKLLEKLEQRQIIVQDAKAKKALRFVKNQEYFTCCEFYDFLTLFFE